MISKEKVYLHVNPNSAKKIVDWIAVRPSEEIKELFSVYKGEVMGIKNARAAELAYRTKLIEEGKDCLRCHRKDMLTIDHNIPKYILMDMGVDVEREFIPENLVLLCRPCNSIKSNRLDFSIPQTKEVLVKLLERL